MNHEDDAAIIAAWLSSHHDLLDRVWQLAPSPPGRLTLLIDLPRAWAGVYMEGDRYVLTGEVLTDVLQAGADLLSWYSASDPPSWIDTDGSLQRVVAFIGGDDQRRLLTAWHRLRTLAIHERQALV